MLGVPSDARGHLPTLQGIRANASLVRGKFVTVCLVIRARVNKAGAGARGLLKRSARAVGVATSAFRPSPDFLIIGAKRAGTTSFYFDLIEHEAILRLYPPPMPRVKADATKGVHYFDSNFTRDDRWYRSYFPTSATRSLVRRRTGMPTVAGEASPFYLFHPAAAERAHRTLPETRIIVLLRDPVLRTYSHWKERRRGDAEELDFLDALDAETDRLAGERERLLGDPGYTSYPWEHQSYFTQSLYAKSLRPWVEAFGRDRIFVAASEDYYQEPNRVLGDVHEFLGLPRMATATGTIRNAAKGAPLEAGLRADLRARFAAPNRELVELLAQTFRWV